MSDRITLVKEFRFEAAHRLPNVEPSNKCHRLHGHSFRVEVVVEGELDEGKGWLMDYADIKAAFEPLRKRLDHYYLNEIEGLENPTSENVARWIWARLQPLLPMLHKVIVHETCTARCEYSGG
jgi:6-pyruvoyltetrahydropterin/6-carboxytetrahydropterin synthase